MYFTFSGIRYRVHSICSACISEVHKYHPDSTIGQGVYKFDFYFSSNRQFRLICSFLLSSLWLPDAFIDFLFAAIDFNQAAYWLVT